jgi:hypothetical protein
MAKDCQTMWFTMRVIEIQRCARHMLDGVAQVVVETYMRMVEGMGGNKDRVRHRWMNGT